MNEITVNPKASEYIMKQPWLKAFIKNAIKDGKTPSDILRALLGENGSYTVDFMFIWNNTPEGSSFWSKIDSEMELVSEQEDWGSSIREINL